MKPLRIEAITVHPDARGALYKLHPSEVTGEVYAIRARPGCSRGHHFHRNMGESFTAVSGEGILVAIDPESGQRQEASLNGQRVTVPAGLAHALFNTGDDDLVVLAFAEGLHDPEDVHPFDVSPP